MTASILRRLVSGNRIRKISENSNFRIRGVNNKNKHKTQYTKSLEYFKVDCFEKSNQESIQALIEKSKNSNTSKATSRCLRVYQSWAEQERCSITA